MIIKTWRGALEIVKIVMFRGHTEKLRKVLDLSMGLVFFNEEKIQIRGAISQKSELWIFQILVTQVKNVCFRSVSKSGQISLGTTVLDSL